jgi:hypothetical protein
MRKAESESASVHLIWVTTSNSGLMPGLNPPAVCSLTFTVKIHARPTGGSGEAASYFRVLPGHGFGLGVSTARK